MVLLSDISLEIYRTYSIHIRNVWYIHNWCHVLSTGQHLFPNLVSINVVIGIDFWVIVTIISKGWQTFCCALSMMSHICQWHSPWEQGVQLLADIGQLSVNKANFLIKPGGFLFLFCQFIWMLLVHAAKVCPTNMKNLATPLTEFCNMWCDQAKVVWTRKKIKTQLSCLMYASTSALYHTETPIKIRFQGYSHFKDAQNSKIQR